MTPATVREAAYNAARHLELDDAECDAIAAAVLAAADAGETEGPWRIRRSGNFWVVERPRERHEFTSEPEARAVCNALNRVHGRTA